MNKKCLYIECPSGISGDMTIGAFLDLGLVTIEELKNIVDDLKIENLTISSKKGEKCGITGTKFDVIYGKDTKHGFDHGHHHHEHTHEETHIHSHETDDTHTHHSHNHTHDHSQDHSHDCDGHNHTHDHNHDHGHHHEHDHDHGHHHHANLEFINELIDNSKLNSNAKEIAKTMFNYIAISESKIHGKSINEVHFHEVGAFDSITDIVLAAYCFDKANVDTVFVSNIHIGSGHVKCDHGILPVPAPATLDILKGLPLYSRGVKSELVTPTGAAILKTVGKQFGDVPVIIIENIGYGLGTKDLEIANVLRLSIGEY